MAGWVLVPCLVALRDEFNQLAPNRDKGSDGSIGDTAHAQESSDHNPDETGRTPYSDPDSINEVHAIDVDNAGPWPNGLTFDQLVQTIVLRHRNNQDNRLQNVIWNRRIWSRSWGWTARAYTGASAHTEHAHFSCRYGSGTAAEGNPEADTRPWGLLALLNHTFEEDGMATISQDDFNTRMDAWWTMRMSPNAADNPARTALRVAPWQQQVGHSGVSTHNMLFGTMLALLQKAAGEQQVDPAQIAQAVLSGLNPAQIAAAVAQSLPPELAKQTADELAARLAS